VTYTYTRYFGEDSLAPLMTCIAELEDDWAGRRPFIDESAAAAGERRLAVLRNAADMLGEPVPPGYGG
jgi:hypothetical protein